MDGVIWTIGLLVRSGIGAVWALFFSLLFLGGWLLLGSAWGLRKGLRDDGRWLAARGWLSAQARAGLHIVLTKARGRPAVVLAAGAATAVAAVAAAAGCWWYGALWLVGSTLLGTGLGAVMLRHPWPLDFKARATPRGQRLSVEFTYLWGTAAALLVIGPRRRWVEVRFGPLHRRVWREGFRGDVEPDMPPGGGTPPSQPASPRRPDTGAQTAATTPGGPAATSPGPVTAASTSVTTAPTPVVAEPAAPSTPTATASTQPTTVPAAKPATMPRSPDASSGSPAAPTPVMGTAATVDTAPGPLPFPEVGLPPGDDGATRAGSPSAGGPDAGDAGVGGGDGSGKDAGTEGWGARFAQLGKKARDRWRWLKRGIATFRRFWRRLSPPIKRLLINLWAAWSRTGPAVKLRFGLGEPFQTGMAQGALASLAGAMIPFGIEMAPYPMFDRAMLWCRGSMRLTIAPDTLMHTAVALIAEADVWKGGHEIYTWWTTEPEGGAGKGTGGSPGAGSAKGGGADSADAAQ